MNSVGGEVRLMFVTRRRVGLQAAFSMAAGAVFLLALLARFIVLVRSPARPGDHLTPGIFGGLSVLGIALLAHGLFLLRSTVRVVVEPVGLRIESHLRRRCIAWADIDRIQRDKRSTMFGQTCRILRVMDRSGKALAAIADTIDSFELLAAEVAARASAAAGHAASDPAEDERRRLTSESRKLRRNAVAFAVFTLGMGAGLCVGIHEELHLRRYATEAVRVDAKIIRRYMVRVTPRVEYAFIDQEGRGRTREAMMCQGPHWDALEGQSTVPVEYLRSNPAWNRLVAGEDPGASFGGVFILVCIGGLVMFGTCFVVTTLGFDVKIENNLVMLTRRGRILRRWGRAPQPPPLPPPSPPPA